MEIKRYALFAGSFYYPSGGIRDFVMTSDDPEELKNHAVAMEDDEEGHFDFQWWHVVDLTTFKYVCTYIDMRHTS